MKVELYKNYQAQEISLGIDWDWQVGYLAIGLGPVTIQIFYG